MMKTSFPALVLQLSTQTSSEPEEGGERTRADKYAEPERGKGGSKRQVSG